MACLVRPLTRSSLKQFYPECAQIQITGGGNQAPTPAELVTFPGGYSNTGAPLALVFRGLWSLIYTDAVPKIDPGRTYIRSISIMSDP